MSMRINLKEAEMGKKRGMGLFSWWFCMFCEVLYTVRSHGSLWARCKVYIVLKNNQLSEQYKRTIS